MNADIIQVKSMIGPLPSNLKSPVSGSKKRYKPFLGLLFCDVSNHFRPLAKPDPRPFIHERGDTQPEYHETPVPTLNLAKPEMAPGYRQRGWKIGKGAQVSNPMISMAYSLIKGLIAAVISGIPDFIDEFYAHSKVA